MSNKELASLFELKISLTTRGDILVDSIGPPDPDSLEKVFDEWNDEYESTKKIVALAKYLKNYTEEQIKDIRKVIG